MVSQSGQMIEVEWQGEKLHFLARKGLFWPREKTLFVADPHFGKAATFHSRQGKTNPVRSLLFQWREACAEVEILLVRGNHDLKSGDPWSELSINCLAEPVQIEKWHCRHHPIEKPELPYLAGHIHPGYSVKGTGRGSVRAACFWVRKRSIILPAFGSFTGLKNIEPQPEDKIYLSNDREIIEVGIAKRF